MVGPRAEEERRSAYRRFQAGLVIVVGGSAGLIAVNGDAALPVVAAASLGGLVVGVVLVWQVFPGRRTNPAQSPTSLGTATDEQSANSIGDDPDATHDDDQREG